jgi:hypothetical protein
MAMRELVEIKPSANLDIATKMLDCLLIAVTLRDFNERYQLIGPDGKATGLYSYTPLNYCY